MKFLENLPTHIFFTGKGGVGKTSVACATACRLANSGKRVLLVSTDPASNIAQVFGVKIGNTITPIESVPGLDSLEINPTEAAEAYRESIIEPVRPFLPEAEIATITEQLSGSCTTEIATFNQFTHLLADPEATSGYDQVIFDTAPTGHTIRLLQLPGDWTGYLDGDGDASCLGPMSGLEKHKSTYARAVAALTDPSLTRIVLVARLQRSTLAEAARTVEELSALDIRPTHLVINGVLPPGQTDLHGAIYAREQAALTDMPESLARLEIDTVGLKPYAVMGAESLATFFDAAEEVPDAQPVSVSAHTLPDLIEELSQDDHGLVIAMGKGGVGKTTIASAIALALVEAGKKVLLTTTDPAAHINTELADGYDNLEIAAIDPSTAIADYRASVMASKGANLDEEGRAALAEDLMSPCTEEIAVFQKFSRAVGRARNQFVVMDTAPTGHTLLLMDATGSYHREIMRHSNGTMKLTTPLMRLQDPTYTKIIITTLPESTPVAEAEELQADLARADITPWAWILNNSLAAAGADSPILSTKAAAEVAHIDHVKDLSPRVALVATRREEPSTARELADLAGITDRK